MSLYSGRGGRLHVNLQVTGEILVAPAPAVPDIPQSNLALWLKGDAGTYTDAAGTTPASANGAEVKHWKDQGPALNHATWPVGSPVPTLVTNAQNGKPAIKLNAGWMDLAALMTLTGAGEIFVVFKGTVDNHENGILAKSTAATTGLSTEWMDVGARYSGLVSTGGNAWSLDATPSTAYITHRLKLGATSVFIALNGGTPNENNDPTVSPVYRPDRIGFNHADFNVTGDVAEIIVYSANQAAGDVTAILNYLKTKYAHY